MMAGEHIKVGYMAAIEKLSPQAYPDSTCMPWHTVKAVQYLFGAGKSRRLA